MGHPFHESVHRRRPLGRAPIPFLFRQKQSQSLGTCLEEQEETRSDEDLFTTSRFSSPSPTHASHQRERNVSLDIGTEARYSGSSRREFPPHSPSSVAWTNRFGARRQLFRFRRPHLPSFQQQQSEEALSAIPSGLTASTSADDSFFVSLPSSTSTMDVVHPLSDFSNIPLSRQRCSRESKAGPVQKMSQEDGPQRQLKRVSRTQQESLDLRRNFEEGEAKSSTTSTTSTTPLSSPSKLFLHRGRSASEQISPSRKRAHVPLRHSGSATNRLDLDAAIAIARARRLEMAKKTPSPRSLRTVKVPVNSLNSKNQLSGLPIGETMDEATFRSHLLKAETSFDDLELHSLASSDSLDIFSFGFPSPPKTLREVRSLGSLGGHQRQRPTWRKGLEMDDEEDLFGGGPVQPLSHLTDAKPLPKRSPLRERRAKPPLTLRTSQGKDTIKAKKGPKSPGIHSPPPCPPPTTPLPDLPPTPSLEESTKIYSKKRSSASSVFKTGRKSSVSSSHKASRSSPRVITDEWQEQHTKDQQRHQHVPSLSPTSSAATTPSGTSSNAFSSSASPPYSVAQSPFTPLDPLYLADVITTNSSNQSTKSKISNTRDASSKESYPLDLVEALSKALDLDHHQGQNSSSSSSSSPSASAAERIASSRVSSAHRVPPGSSLGLTGIPAMDAVDENDGQVIYGFAL